MKAINPKAQKHLLLQPAVAKRLNNPLFKKALELKASSLVCLFLFAIPILSPSQDLVFDQNLQEAYQLALNLRTEEALKKIPEQNSVEEVYIASLAETI